MTAMQNILTIWDFFEVIVFFAGFTLVASAIRCPDPGIPENGGREGESFEVGAKVRFKCLRGYDLIGSLERYCMPNGEWTGEVARCDTQINRCPDPGLPENGGREGDSFEVGAKVRFKCFRGYDLIGSLERYCLSDGEWTGEVARCESQSPYDFEISTQMTDILNTEVTKKAEEETTEQQKNKEDKHSSWHNGSVPQDRISYINYPGRLIFYFAFDVSGSVGLHNFDKSIQFAKAIVKRVGISENGTRAGALTYGSKTEIMFLPVSYKKTDDVLEALDRIEYTEEGTAAIINALRTIQEAMMPLMDYFLEKKNTKSLIFIFTDGKANMGGSPTEVADKLKKAGVEIYCIGITGNIEKDYLNQIASTSKTANGEYPNVYILQNYAALSWLVEEIISGTIDYSQCGLEMDNDRTEGNGGKVVGGRISIKPWPWMAALYMPYGTAMDLMCGGSIIHENFILTAAHCMFDDNWVKRTEKSVIVKLGITDVKNETYVQVSEVKTIFLHPQYRPGPLFDYDIALLLLNRSIEYNHFVRPICLPPKESPVVSPFYKSTEIGWVIGWGHQGVVHQGSRDRITSSQFLRELPMPIQSRERCKQFLTDKNLKRYLFTDRMFCAGDGKGGKDSCQGDSGGPFMQSQLKSDGYLYWTQVGIVSWGIGCGQENTYGVYSHVQRLRQWIDDTIHGALRQS